MVLPRFVIPEEQQVVVPESVMRAAVEAMFRAVGMSAADAAECALSYVPIGHATSVGWLELVFFSTAAKKHAHSSA